MAEEKILFEGATSRLDLKVVEQPDHSALVKIIPAAPENQIPEWDERSTQQANDLMGLLRASFGKENITRAPSLRLGEEAVQIAVPAHSPSATEHAQHVAQKVYAFAEEHQMELDTGDAQHFREIVDHAAKMDLRSGIKRLVQDQLLDADQKTDGILDLVSRKRGNGGVGGLGGGSN